jgi:hypothetical protein
MNNKTNPAPLNLLKLLIVSQIGPRHWLHVPPFCSVVEDSPEHWAVTPVRGGRSDSRMDCGQLSGSSGGISVSKVTAFGSGLFGFRRRLGSAIRLDLRAGL